MLHSSRTRAFTSSSSSQTSRRLLLSRNVPQRCVVADASLKETPATLVMEKGELVEFPEQPAVYAVYNKDDQIQYIGLTRKVRWMPCACMSLHAQLDCNSAHWHCRCGLRPVRGRGTLTASVLVSCAATCCTCTALAHASVGCTSTALSVCLLSLYVASSV